MAVPTLGLPLDRDRPLLPQLREARPAELAVAAVVSVAVGCLLAATDIWLVFALVGVALFVALGTVRPALFLGLVILVRPLLDDVSDVTIGAPSGNVGGALALALILTLALLTARRRRLIVPAAAPALVLAIAVSAVSALHAWQVFGSTVGTDAVGEVLRVGALLAAFVLAANSFGTPERVRLLFVLVALCGVVPAITGLVEWLNGPQVAVGLDVARISGSFVGPVPYGAFLAVTALVLLFLPSGWMRRSLRLAAVLLVCAALVGSSSREGWVIFMAGVLMLGWRARPQLVAVVTIGIVALLVLVPTVRERALPTASGAPGATTQESYASWQWRTENWRGLLDKWREQPVFGYGLMSTTSVNPRAPVSSRGLPGGGFDAHSLVVRLLVEGGVILAAAYAFFFGAVLRGVWRLARDPWELRRLGRLLLVLWALLLIVGMTTDDPFDSTAVVVPLFALTGALEAARRSLQQPTVARPVSG